MFLNQNFFSKIQKIDFFKKPAFSENLDFKDTGAEYELLMKILQCNQVILSRNLAFGAKLPEPAFTENHDFKDTGAEYPI